MKYKFTLERRKKNGVVIEQNMPIRITINHDNKRITLSTGFRTDIKAWNSAKQVIKQGYINSQGEPYNVINAKLSEQTIFIDKFNAKHQIEDLKISLDDLKIGFAEQFLRRNNTKHIEEVSDKSFFELFDTFIEERGKQNDWTTATFTKFKAVRKHLFGFDQQLNLDLLNEDKLTDYVMYLRGVGNMKNTTIKKQLGFLKWFLNWAVEKAHTSNVAFRSFKPKLKTAEKQVIYLDKEELEKVRNYEIPETKQYLDRVRDVFLFCCYTSLRYSDVYQLKRNNIINDRIEIITQKTTDKLRIKLNSKALSILEKYSPTIFKGNKVLPVISNQRMNDYLKELCKLAEINETISIVYFIGNKRHEEEYPKFALVGTHTGRRTFICNALRNGMPVHAVMEITGHSDYKAMQPYIDIAKKDIDNMIDEFIDF